MGFKKKGWFLFVLLFSFVLMGCTSNTGNTDKTQEENKGTNEESKEVQGGKLNFANDVEPSTLDPHFTTSVPVRNVSRQIYESLVTFDSKYQVQPMLAESFERSEDGKKITFYLRKGVLFHNGEEMTAKDVVASMEKWQKQSGNAMSFLEGTEYEAVDDYTVIAHIGNPSILDMQIFADLTQLAAIMPKSIVENAGEEDVDEYIGTGPFKFEEWRQGQYIHLSKFEEYQPRSEAADGMAGEKKALVDDVYFHFVTEPSTRVTGMLTGEYDIANRIIQDSVETLRANPNVKLELIQAGFPGLVFNKRSGLFSNQSARQAVNAAMNMEDLLIAGYASEEFYSLSHELSLEEQTSWYTDAGKAEYTKYDPESAKQLLAEAGYNGEEITILTSRANQDHYNIAVVAQAQMQAIGMNVKLDLYDWSTLLERRNDDKAYDIFITGFSIEPIPIQYSFFNSKWPGWTNSEEINRLLTEINYADSTEEALQLTTKLQQEFWEYLPIIKPGNRIEVTAMREGVNGYSTFANGPILWNVSIDK